MKVVHPNRRIREPRRRHYLIILDLTFHSRKQSLGRKAMAIEWNLHLCQVSPVYCYHLGAITILGPLHSVQKIQSRPHAVASYNLGSQRGKACQR